MLSCQWDYVKSYQYKVCRSCKYSTSNLHKTKHKPSEVAVLFICKFAPRISLFTAPLTLNACCLPLFPVPANNFLSSPLTTFSASIVYLLSGLLEDFTIQHLHEEF